MTSTPLLSLYPIYESLDQDFVSHVRKNFGRTSDQILKLIEIFEREWPKYLSVKNEIGGFLDRKEMVKRITDLLGPVSNIHQMNDDQLERVMMDQTVSAYLRSIPVTQPVNGVIIFIGDQAEGIL